MTTHRKETVKEQARRMNLSISKVRKLRQGTYVHKPVDTQSTDNTAKE